MPTKIISRRQLRLLRIVETLCERLAPIKLVIMCTYLCKVDAAMWQVLGVPQGPGPGDEKIAVSLWDLVGTIHPLQCCRSLYWTYCILGEKIPKSGSSFAVLLVPRLSATRML